MSLAKLEISTTTIGENPESIKNGYNSRREGTSRSKYQNCNAAKVDCWRLKKEIEKPQFEVILE